MNQPNDGTEFDDPLQNYDPKKYRDSLEKALAEETVARIQHRPHSSISPDAKVAEAIEQLAAQHVACLLVEENGDLVGVFTDRETLNAMARDIDLREATVRDVMSKNPVFVYTTDPAAAALCVMAVGGFRHVPIIDVDEKIAGVVSPQRVTAFLSKHFSPK
ncbi:cyclic nucleotide-binding/CBS domain-containing protein [Planctomycetota bacterium]